MKKTPTLFTRLAAMAAALALTLFPATMSAQTVVYSNTMSATTASGVSLTDPIYTSGSWTVSANGASAELGTTGENNYGPCLASPSVGNYIAVKADVPYDGQYVCSFRVKLDSGTYAIATNIGYGTSLGSWTYPSTNLNLPITMDADEPGDLHESGTMTLSAGTYYFVYYVTNYYSSGTNLHVADFKLTYMGALPDYYTVTYTHVGNPADIYMIGGGEEVANGTAFQKWSQVEIYITPENSSDPVSVEVTGGTSDNFYNYGTYYCLFLYVINQNISVVINVGNVDTGISNQTNDDAVLTYDTKTAQLTGCCKKADIYDLSGKLAATVDLQGTADLSSLPKGVYIVKTAKKTIKIVR